MIMTTSTVTNITREEIAETACPPRDTGLEPDRGGSPEAGRESFQAARKLQMLKRAGLFGQDLKGATIERACGVDDLRKAYRLVHDVYLGTGFIDPEPSGMRLRIFETTSETATFVAKVDDRVVGVLSVVTDSEDLGLPSDCAFKTELDELRATGARLCEVTNQAVAEEYRRSAVPTELMRCAIARAMQAGCHEAVAAVSPSHNGFYDLLGFRQTGSQRSYSRKIDDPVILLSLEVAQYQQPRPALSTIAQFMYDFLCEGNHFISRVTDWAKEARKHFANPAVLHELFVCERNFLGECSPAELEILQGRWGEALFDAVRSGSSLPLESDGDEYNGWRGVSAQTAST